MASREQINAYRVKRPDSVLSDDMIAWELDAAPDCAADIPAEFKVELERLAYEDDDRPPAMGGATARAPLSLYDYASSPHGGRWKPLPDHGGEPTISPTTHIHHSIVGSGAGAWGFFANSTSLESTNIVLKSGELWQCMSRREQADANYKANAFAISTETEDNGNPNTDPWTPAQLDTLVWVTLQDIRDFGVARRICPAWDGGGVGYHTLFGAPSQWTPSSKTCPGTVRIRQWNDIVIPRVLGTLEEEDTVSAAEVIAWFKSEEGIRLLRKATWGGSGEEIPSIFGTVNAAQVVEATAKAAQGANSKAGDLATAVAAIASRVTAIESDVDHLVAGGVPAGGGRAGPLKLSPHEVAHVATAAGWIGDDLRTAVAVCLAESGGDTGIMARSDTGASLGNRDHGLWQVSGRWHGDKLQDHPDWRTPATNAALAHRIWSDAGGWTPWAVFNSGSYEKYLPDADIALAAPFAVTS